MGVKFTAQSVANALVASTTRTQIQLIAATNAPFVVCGYSVSFDGVSALTPVRIQLARQTSAGTTGSSPTIYNYGSSGLTAQTTAAKAFSSTEPTTTDILEDDYFPVNGGCFKVWYPLGREPYCASAGRLAIIVITPSGVTPNCNAGIVWEE